MTMIRYFLLTSFLMISLGSKAQISLQINPVALLRTDLLTDISYQVNDRANILLMLDSYRGGNTYIYSDATPNAFTVRSSRRFTGGLGLKYYLQEAGTRNSRWWIGPYIRGKSIAFRSEDFVPNQTSSGRFNQALAGGILGFTWSITDRLVFDMYWGLGYELSSSYTNNDIGKSLEDLQGRPGEIPIIGLGQLGGLLAQVVGSQPEETESLEQLDAILRITIGYLF